MSFCLTNQVEVTTLRDLLRMEPDTRLRLELYRSLGARIIKE
jgi:hypothetical protein